MFSEESRLGWLEIEGEAQPLATRTTMPFNEDRLSFVQPRFTANGKRLSVIVKADVYRPYVYDTDRGSFERVVLDKDDASSAISPDGKKLAYSTNKDGPYTLFVRDLASGTDKQLHEAPAEYHCGIAWSPDGKYLTFAMPPDTRSRRDVWVLDVTADPPQAKPFCDGPADQRAPEFSPNMRWLAYVSDESGQREVYVRRFPDGQLSQQVTFGGGDWPQWSPSGDRIYFRNKSKLYAVPFSPTEGASGKRPTLEYDHKFGQSDFDLPDYTVAPDGRLLLVEPSERAPTASEIKVLLNWPTLVRRK
jgi:Tol biopolymer transport system component